jgi:hypothetical protein
MLSKTLYSKSKELLLPVLVNSEVNLTQTSVIRAKNNAEQMMTLKTLIQTKIFIDFLHSLNPKFLFAMFLVGKFFIESALKICH